MQKLNTEGDERDPESDDSDYERKKKAKKEKKDKKEKKKDKKEKKHKSENMLEQPPSSSSNFQKNVAPPSNKMDDLLSFDSKPMQKMQSYQDESNQGFDLFQDGNA